MKILGFVSSNQSSNANLLCKILSYLSNKNEIRVLSVNASKCLGTIYGFQTYWALTNIDIGFSKRVFSRLADGNGYGDKLTSYIIESKIHEIKKEYDFDTIITTSEPFFAPVASMNIRNVKKVLYLMDPPGGICGLYDTSFRNRTFKKVLSSQNCILTTPFIRSALFSAGIKNTIDKIVTVGFPMIDDTSSSIKQQKNEVGISLLFCGWLCSEIRSPKYFLDIVSRLDERFHVKFMGKECDKLFDRFTLQTKAEVETVSQQPYEVALQAMADADILINIGNSIPVHMPSKTLEYINTGKPFVNFYKYENCTTLYYTKRYPRCLDLFEGDENLDAATDKFIAFCEENIGKKVDREFIKKEYKDCTPQYIAEKIIESLEN